MKVAALHEQMVRNVFLNVELVLNDGIRELSEYDLQAWMFLHFRYSLANQNAHADREKTKRVDCVLFAAGVPRVFYEIKTYFKKHEKLRKKHFDDDINKLYGLLKTHAGTRGFFLVAGAKSKFTDTALLGFPLVKSHLKDQKHGWVNYPLQSGDIARLRPSQKQRHGRSVVVTWEVKT